MRPKSKFSLKLNSKFEFYIIENLIGHISIIHQINIGDFYFIYKKYKKKQKKGIFCLKIIKYSL